MNKITLPLSVSTLIESIGERSDFTTREIIDIIRNCNIQEKDLIEFTDFEHDKKEGYGRKVMYQSDYYEILVMSWAPRDYTAIHNHGYTKWGAVQTFGRLEHSTFNFEDELLTSLFKEKLVANEIIAIEQDMIHQMGNPYDKNTLSIHIYGTPYKVTNVTDNSQLYEVGKEEIQLVDGGVYYDLPNSDVAISFTDLYSDRLTLIGHYVQLLNYYFKSGTRGPQYQKAINYFLDRSFESRLITELDMDSNCVLYMIELKKAQKLLKLLSESTQIIDSVLSDINDPDSYS